VPEKDSWADRKLRDGFTVKGVSRETMNRVRDGELEIVGDDDQTETLKQLGGQE